MLLLVVLVTSGLVLLSPAAQAADTGNAAPQTGKIVSDEPGRNTPNILDGTVYSIAKVGNTVVVGGNFTQANSGSGTATVTRRGVLAFDATSGKISSAFAPDALGTVYKVLPAADGKSVYVAGGFSFAGGASVPGRIFKINATTGVIDPTFVAPTISGDIRDLQLVGNHLFIAGKFTHINGIAQKALGTLYADNGKRDPYFSAVFAGLHNTTVAGAVTNVLQISVNKQNTQLMAVGNFTTVDGQNRHQIAKFDIGNVPTAVDPNVHQTLSGWYTNLFTSACSSKFDTYMSDVEFSPNGQFFVVSTTGAYGGAAGSQGGTVGCDVVARFESNVSAGPTPAAWTAYTGGDTTWTVEVTDNVVYAGGHQRWQNNPGPNSGDKAGDGAVSREGIAALSTVTGLPFSWNPTRARGVGVQDMLATSDGLYVGSDTELLGHTTGNTYHARIAYLPLAGGGSVPQLQTTPAPTTAAPTNLFRVASAASQLTKRTFTGTTVGTATNVAAGPGWGTSTGAFMVNGVLYQTKTDGTLSKMTFDGTAYGTATPVNTADALVSQVEWHTDAKTISTLFYSGGYIYYAKTGTNALYRRAFEVESGVVGQQRFSTTSTGINWSSVRGAFVAGGKLFYATTAGNLWQMTWNQAGHAPVNSTNTQITTAGTGWSSRAMFPYQGVPAAANEAPVANASISCNAKVCSFDGTASSDADGTITYDWDFGDGTSHGSGATTTHTYADAGDRAVTLTVTDNKGATNATTRTASPSNQADSISFVNRANNNGSRSTHTIAVPAGTEVGDTLLLFFASNSTAPVYAGPPGWTEIESENATSFVGRAYTKTATAADIGATPTTPGANVSVTSRNADGTGYTVKSDLTIASYRGVGTPAIGGATSTSQSFPSTVHQTPTIDAEDGTSWLVSYWTDKSTTATGVPTNWTGPTSQTQRSEGTANGSSHMSSLLTDSNKRVGKGGQGGLNASADVSAQGLTMSILLEGKGEAPANQNPVSNPTLLSCNGLTCSFDGTSSTDPDGGTLSYDWDWNDGTGHSTAEKPSHTFASGGNKAVTLTVSDGQGGSNSNTVTATPVDPPANQAPTALITGVSCTGLSCTFDGSTSSDPDPDTLTYSWDFGDGTGTSTTGNPTYLYQSAGQRTVTLVVNDGHGNSDDATVVVNPQVANAAPTVDITDVTCTDLSCAFTTTASDPDNDPLTYSWDFGDGTGSSTEANPTYAYTSAGAKNVTVTVNDGNSHTANDTATANPVDPGGDPDPVSNIAFVGTASSVGNSTSRAVTIPTAVEAGDTLVLFIGSASSGRTFTAPAGWTLLENKDGSSSMGVRAWTKTATAAEASNTPATGVKVTVAISSTTKADLTLGAYRNTDATTPIAASASKIDDSAGAAHTSPAVTAANGTSWLVTYWADRSTTSTGWTTPAGVTVRWPGQPDTSSAHALGLLGDSNGAVSAGPQGQLTATANGDSSRGGSVSILLNSN